MSRPSVPSAASADPSSSRKPSGLSTARAVAWRALHNFYGNPRLFMPSLIFPLFFFVAFNGGVSRVGDLPGFDYPPGYATFQWAFTYLQGASFAGMFLGFSVIRDFETGFLRRLELVSQSRVGIVFGFMIAAAGRCVVTMAWITLVGALFGVRPTGSFVELFGVFVLGLLSSQVAAAWAVGVAMRLRSAKGGPLMQVPVMLSFFLGPVFVPLALLAGWLRTVGDYNPVSRVLTAIRALLAGNTPEVLPVLVSIGALVAFGFVWLVRSYQASERQGY